MEPDTQSNCYKIQTFKEIEKDFYERLGAEIKKANLKEPDEIASFYREFIQKYKLKIREEDNFHEVQDKIQKEMYLETVKKEKKVGIDKSRKFHTGWGGLLKSKAGCADKVTMRELKL